MRCLPYSRTAVSNNHGPGGGDNIVQWRLVRRGYCEEKGHVVASCEVGCLCVIIVISALGVLDCTGLLNRY